MKKRERTRKYIEELWKLVFDNYKMREIQEVTGHDRDE